MRMHLGILRTPSSTFTHFHLTIRMCLGISLCLTYSPLVSFCFVPTLVMSWRLSKKLKPIHPIHGFIIVNKTGFPFFTYGRSSILLFKDFFNFKSPRLWYEKFPIIVELVLIMVNVSTEVLEFKGINFQLLMYIKIQWGFNFSMSLT